jgi:type IV secretory pathway TrbL component
VFLIIRIFVAAFLAMFVLDLNFYTGIISWMAKLGASVGGVPMTSNSSSVIDYSPSGFFDLMWAQFYPIISALMLAAGGAGLFSTATGNFLFGLCGIIIICIFTMVFVVMLTLIEAYFVIFAGIILAGFAGSSWTMNYWQKYLSYVGGVAIRLFCTSILLGLISAQWSNPSWLIKLPAGTDWLDSSAIIIKNLLAMLGAFGFDMILMVTLPSKAAAMLNGYVNAGLGEAIGAASMAMAGGRMISSTGSGLIGGASSIAKGVSGAGAAAKSAAYKTMRDGAKNSISPSGGGSDAKWKDMVRSSGQNAAKTAATDSVKGGLSNAKQSFTDSIRSTKSHAGTYARNAGAVSGAPSGGSHLNIDPHKH